MASDDSENATMSTDLFVTLFMVMLLAIGATPAVIKAPDDVEKGVNLKTLYLYADDRGDLHFSSAFEKAIPVTSLANILRQKLTQTKPDTLNIVVLPNATAPEIGELIDLVNDVLTHIENSNVKSVSWSILDS